ncbi:hypothetical protein [Novosphingobium sp. JCM 18896]|uniref:hypothetical protein n=1 Tax=Novosphingobium sp. JCM 18896 TaxID=2989731 RepID=UPI0022236EFB|nr:hypothetical protein [Novosphingobium sp. JCM 18896]MCW1431498.1 hypothetical protein [Novosphingobium sp. JCM 18896]
MKLRLLLSLSAVAAIATAGAVSAQRSDLSVDQVTPNANRAVEQIGNADARHSPGMTQVSRNAVPAAPNQVSSPRAGRDPALGQLSTRAAGNAPTAQLSTRNTPTGVAALPPGLADACDRAAAGQGPAPKGVDCSIVVQAAPPAVLVSAEQTLLTTDNERDGQRIAAERFARGNAPDAGEVALRLQTGDIANSPVAQAVAAQAAAAAVQNAAAGTPGTVSAGGATIVPGGASLGAPPAGN